MTEVSVSSSSGEIARVAQGRVRKGTKERETQRSPWRGGITGRGAVPGTESSTPLGCRVPKGARENTARIGGTHCASWVGDMTEALTRLSWVAS